MEQCSTCKHWGGNDSVYSHMCHKHDEVTPFNFCCHRYTAKTFRIKKNTPLTDDEIIELKDRAQ